MNKGDLIEIVASELGQSKAAAARAVQAVIAAIGDGLKTQESVTIAGFGTFTKRQRAARRGTNPSTGEPMTIEASRTIGFKPSPALKDSLQAGIERHPSGIR
jgi:DNA-binding protein HU-beta